MNNQFYQFDILTRARQPAGERIRIDANGGQIEIRPIEGGIEILWVDVGSPGRLVVVPRASNHVRVEILPEE